MDEIKIAQKMFADGLRARDCAAWDMVKKYNEELAVNIIEKLAEIEIKHLNAI